MLIMVKIHKRSCPTCDELGHQCEMCVVDPLPELKIGQSVYFKDDKLTTFAYSKSTNVGNIWELQDDHCKIKIHEPMPPKLLEMINAAEAAYAVK